jgi:hypothetical protein
VPKADNLTTILVPLSCNLETLTSWNPLEYSRPVTGLLYLYLFKYNQTVRCLLIAYRITMTTVFDMLYLLIPIQFERLKNLFSLMVVHLKYWSHDTGVGGGAGGTEGCSLYYYIPLRHRLPHILTRQIPTPIKIM